ncbi:flagellar hook assembly protein FlgD [Bosea rubneri]|uniref:Basal-body rod modification protein FlgD n=1 Tax=Bosea rubneri TaxID=3075434 RepID=A0ABU3S2M1_9HYPH|nr:flagellar hook capping FlgD N-terminal domain-containing protein [Bosea sp. ZW T0_25]MDU0338951.1 flagellar hook capping FlgD N-terminal domain-containing protein [Bosea sp. ZW T0_25]
MSISNTGKLSNSAVIAAQNGTNASGGGTSIANNFDQFLTLLTTQLKNQNPLDPLDTNQFTQQLVQFAGVEQQLKQNETLTALLGVSKATTGASAIGFVGQKVTADGAATQLKDDKAEWKLNASKGGTATITIKDVNGKVVQTATTTLTAGDQSYRWDGKTSTGSVAPEGEYTITVDATDISGAAITVKTEVTGIVDGVDFSTAVPTLLIGAIKVPLDRVKSVKSNS